MNTRYDVGDVVKIRDDLESEKYYTMSCDEDGSIYCNESMAEMRGNRVCIFEVVEYHQGDRTHYYYHIEQEDGYLNEWAWSDDMFESRQQHDDIVAAPLCVLYEWA